MAYQTDGYMGCSVKEVCGFNDWDTPSHIKDLLNKGGATLCVTNHDYQKKAEKSLEKAGFMPVAEFTNLNHHSRCRIWAAFAPKTKMELFAKLKKPRKKKALCPTHTRYQAKRAPRSKCKTCWEVWYLKTKRKR